VIQAGQILIEEGTTVLDRDILLVLIGGAVGVGGALMGAIVNHLLDLRTDRVRRARDRSERYESELRSQLTRGVERFGVRDYRAGSLETPEAEEEEEEEQE
jgi:hypothetical protein